MDIARDIWDECWKKPEFRKAYAAMWIRFRFNRDHPEIENRQLLGISMHVT